MKHSPMGYSAVTTYEQCPFRYKCQYKARLKPEKDIEASNPLLIGTALHRGVETDAETAIKEYLDSFPIINDKCIDEEIKLRYLIPKVKAMIPDGTHEVQVVDTNFIGTLDFLAPVEDGVFDLYDFKYINAKNQDRYADSRQLHLYKYYFEKTNPGKRIRNMSFILIPKVQIRQKQSETPQGFRMRLVSELEKVQPIRMFIDYDPQKVIDHLEVCQKILQDSEFPKNPTKLCGWCDYKQICEGEIEMLPSIERVPTNIGQYKKMWIYGAPFSGKTTLVDGAPVPLNLNTDGNVKTVTMARLPIKDTMVGRQKKLAWEVFKEAIDDLEAGSDFKTIVVDLLEDTYESCRLWMYKQMGITHESDDSFRAWDKVRTEFLSTFRKLLNLPYNVVLISHEDLSKDITKRSGDKVTAIKPNLADKVANKIAGMVDIVCRVVVEDNGRFLSFKSDSVVFGGGRITGHGKTTIPLSWKAVEEFYGEVSGQQPVPVVEEVEELPTEPVVVETTEDETPKEIRVEMVIGEGHSESMALEEPKRRTRRTRQ